LTLIQHLANIVAQNFSPIQKRAFVPLPAPAPAAAPAAAPPGAGGEIDPNAAADQIIASMGGGAGAGQAGQAGQAVSPIGQMPNIKDEIKNVLQETGVIKTPKIRPEEHFEYVSKCLATLAGAMGVQLPPPPSSPLPGAAPASAPAAAPASNPVKQALDRLTSL